MEDSFNSCVALSTVSDLSETKSLFYHLGNMNCNAGPIAVGEDEER